MDLPPSLRTPRMVALLLLLLHSLGVLVASLAIYGSGDGLEVQPWFFAGLSMMVAAGGLSLVFPPLRGSVLLPLYLASAVVAMRGLEVAVRHPLLYGIDTWQHLGYATLDLRRGLVVQVYEGGPGHQVWVGTVAYLTGASPMAVMRYGPIFLTTLTGLVLFLIGKALGGRASVGLWALLLYAIADVDAFFTPPQYSGLLLTSLFILALVNILPAPGPLDRWSWTCILLLAFGGASLTHALSLGIVTLVFIAFALGRLLTLRRHAPAFAGVGAILAGLLSRDRTLQFANSVLAPIATPLGGLLVLALALVGGFALLWLLLGAVRPRALRLLGRLLRPIAPDTTAAASSLCLTLAFLGLGMAGGLSSLSFGKTPVNFLVDNIFKVVLGALALGGAVHMFKLPANRPGWFLVLWILPMVAVFFAGTFLAYRLDPVRYLPFILLPLALLAGVFVVRSWGARQMAAFAVGVLALLPLTYSPLIHTGITPGRTYPLVSNQTYEAAQWIEDHGIRPTAVGTDIRLSSVIYGVGPYGIARCNARVIIKGTYGYAPWVFTDPEVVPGNKLDIALKTFDCIGIGYIFYDRDMITYGASIRFYGAGGDFTLPLTARELGKFGTQPMFNQVYDSGDTWVFHVNPRAVP